MFKIFDKEKGIFVNDIVIDNKGELYQTKSSYDIETSEEKTEIELLNKNNFIICLSTNLSDKNNKELYLFDNVVLPNRTIGTITNSVDFELKVETEIGNYYVMAKVVEYIQSSLECSYETNLKNKYKQCLEFANKVHEHQLDLAGKAYIEHPLYLSAQCDNYKEKIVAILHDVLEDGANIEEYKKIELPSEIDIAINYLTRTKNMTYKEYIERISHNELATKIKILDLKHNMDISRLGKTESELTKEEKDRIKKYKKYLKKLESIQK